jgi:hypothetical protein
MFQKSDIPQKIFRQAKKRAGHELSGPAKIFFSLSIGRPETVAPTGVNSGDRPQTLLAHAIQNHLPRHPVDHTRERAVAVPFDYPDESVAAVIFEMRALSEYTVLIEQTLSDS